ncbi:MAG: leucine-rich repeat domain-containing protein [Eubacterium sp.]|nr:leucine-rich repeat domain-containing protein [Eubacterium sp.]
MRTIHISRKIGVCIAILLSVFACAFALSFVNPQATYAATNTVVTGGTSDGVATTIYVDYGHVIFRTNSTDSTIKEVYYYTAADTTVTLQGLNGAEPDPDGYILTTSSENATDGFATVQSGTWNITINDMNLCKYTSASETIAPTYMGDPISVMSGASVNLTVLGTNTLIGATNEPGIRVQNGASLTITAKSTGTLNAYGKVKGAGIGGRYTEGFGDITINGGTVTAVGADGGAGIGGGGASTTSVSGYKYGTITINGGTVNASSVKENGGNQGAGIGGGNAVIYSDGATYVGGGAGNIVINGGKVTAKGGYASAGIGSGAYSASTSDKVTINGGTVTASAKTGPGIGAGSSGVSVSVDINGGTISASSNYGAGIGGGAYSTADVNIADAVVTASSKYCYALGSGYKFSGTDGALDIDGAAYVKANSSGSNAISSSVSTSSWGGTVFLNKTGYVYGTSVLLPASVQVPSGYTLEIAAGHTLTVPKGITFTNNGTINLNGNLVVYGTFTNNGTLNNNGTIEEIVDNRSDSDDNSDSDSDSNSNDNSNSDSDSDSAESLSVAAVGTTFTAGKLRYKVTAEGKVNVIGAKSKRLKKMTIPATVKDSSGNVYKVVAIGNAAFKNMKKLKTVTIGKNVTTIGKKAFYNCKKLKKITFANANKLKTVKAKAFKGTVKKAKVIVKIKKEKKFKKLVKKLKKVGLKKAKFKFKKA